MHRRRNEQRAGGAAHVREALTDETGSSPIRDLIVNDKGIHHQESGAISATLKFPVWQYVQVWIDFTAAVTKGPATMHDNIRVSPSDYEGRWMGLTGAISCWRRLAL